LLGAIAVGHRRGGRTGAAGLRWVGGCRAQVPPPRIHRHR